MLNGSKAKVRRDWRRDRVCGGDFDAWARKWMTSKTTVWKKTEIWDQERRAMQSQKTSKFFENSVFFSLQRLREQI